MPEPEEIGRSQRAVTFACPADSGTSDSTASADLHRREQEVAALMGRCLSESPEARPKIATIFAALAVASGDGGPQGGNSMNDSDGMLSSFMSSASSGFTAFELGLCDRVKVVRGLSQFDGSV